MITPYSKSDLQMLDISFLNKFLGNIRAWGNKNNISIELSCRQHNEYKQIKKAIEYKFGLPMPLAIKNGDYHYLLNPTPYTTHRLLQMLMPLWTKKKIGETKAEEIIKRTKRAKLTIYAAGGIEKAPDHGIGYRNALAQVMQMVPVTIINPCDFTYNQNYKSTSAYKKEHNIHSTYKFARQIINGDLSAVEYCDVVAVNIDQYVGYGSTSEATIARYLDKPVYGIISQDFDINNINNWLLGCIDRFFDSINQFREFILQCEKSQ